MKRLVFVLAVSGLMSVMASSAFGDTYSFYLTVPENSCTTTNPPCAPADTALVDVTTPSGPGPYTTATVTFTGEAVGGNLYGLYEALFEVNGSFGISSYVVTGGSAAGTHTGATPGSIDLYGTFSEESVVLHDASSVVFNLDDGSWANVASVLTTTPLANGNAGHYAQPFDAAAEVRVSVCTSSTEPGCTGDTGTDGKTMDTAGFAVPEPASLLLFGSLVLGLATFVRRKSSASAGS
jgi:hypothetical protein